MKTNQEIEDRYLAQEILFLGRVKQCVMTSFAENFDCENNQKFSIENFGTMDKGLREIFEEMKDYESTELKQTRDKLIRLEAEFERKFKPNKTIKISIPQTQRPKPKIQIFEQMKKDQNSELEDKIDHLSSPDSDDNISIITFRPEEGQSDEEYQKKVLDRKIEKLSAMLKELKRKKREKEGSYFDLKYLKYGIVGLVVVYKVGSFFGMFKGEKDN